MKQLPQKNSGKKSTKKVSELYDTIVFKGVRYQVAAYESNGAEVTLKLSPNLNESATRLRTAMNHAIRESKFQFIDREIMSAVPEVALGKAKEAVEKSKDILKVCSHFNDGKVPFVSQGNDLLLLDILSDDKFDLLENMTETSSVFSENFDLIGTKENLLQNVHNASLKYDSRHVEIVWQSLESAISITKSNIELFFSGRTYGESNDSSSSNSERAKEDKKNINPSTGTLSPPTRKNKTNPPTGIPVMVSCINREMRIHCCTIILGSWEVFGYPSTPVNGYLEPGVWKFAGNSKSSQLLIQDHGKFKIPRDDQPHLTAF